MKLQEKIDEFLKGESKLEVSKLKPIQIFYALKTHTDKCIEKARDTLKQHKQTLGNKTKNIIDLPACEALKLLDEEVSDSADCILSDEEPEESEY